MVIIQHATGNRVREYGRLRFLNSRWAFEIVRRCQWSERRGLDRRRWCNLGPSRGRSTVGWRSSIALFSLNTSLWFRVELFLDLVRNLDEVEGALPPDRCFF